MGPGLRKIGAVQKLSRLQCCGGAFLADVFCTLVSYRNDQRFLVGRVKFPGHNTAFLLIIPATISPLY